MNIIELSKIMASYQSTVKTPSYKPGGSLFVLVDANILEGGLMNILYGINILLYMSISMHASLLYYNLHKTCIGNNSYCMY